MTTLKKIVVLTLMLLFSVETVLAHPLDVSSTTFVLQDTTLQGVSYLHNYEVNMMLAKKGYTITEIGEVYKYEKELLDYFAAHIALKNNDKDCKIQNLRLIQKEPFQVLSSGFQIEYDFVCPDRIQAMIPELNLFTDFELQTNRLSIVESDGTEVYYKVGTHKITKLPYTRGVKIEQIDTDQDGVSDEEELVYKTDAKNRDTDGDYYLDGEEINYGWNPLSNIPSYGQNPRTAYPETFLVTPKNGISQTGATSAPVVRDLSQNGMGSDVFQKVLKMIGKTISKEEITPFFIIFFLVMGLGFLHAIGPGHAKSLLTAMMIHKKASFGTGLKFIGIFSVTHIIDILLLYGCLTLFMKYFDATTLLNFIPKVSAIVLLLLGTYLGYRAYKGYEEEEDFSTGRTWIMGIIAGLAPCTFGWSLFFLLLSLGKYSWIPWLIGAIAIGIFLCLLLVLTIIHFSKNSLYSKFSSASTYSLYFSAGFIFLLGCYFTLKSFIL